MRNYNQFIILEFNSVSENVYLNGINVILHLKDKNENEFFSFH